MATKAPFLNSPYSAYLHREVPSEDAELTHVGPGTPGGEYLRRFWHPVAFSDDLRTLPRAVRVMGEDLVVFRDGSGRVGLLELHCAHRGTSLEYGRISERGIRCCYHGWLFDVDGRVLETPTEPRESTLKDRLFHGAYPTLEYKGLVFAYLGPPEKKPVFPIYDSYDMPGYRVIPAGTAMHPCNWLQIKENIMDPFHTVFLHAILTRQFSSWMAEYPQLAWQQTDIGCVSVAVRRTGEYVWIKVNDWIAPNIHQFGTDLVDDSLDAFEVEGPWETKWGVPIDDTNTLTFRLLYLKEKVLEGLGSQQQEDFVASMIAKVNVGEGPDQPYEERQMHPGDYDAQVSQRPIAVHAMERLGVTDRGVTLLRKLLRQGIRSVREGKDPIGAMREQSSPIPTYAHHRLVRIAPQATPEAEIDLLQRVATIVAASPGRSIGARPDELLQELQPAMSPH